MTPAEITRRMAHNSAEVHTRGNRFNFLSNELESCRKRLTALTEQRAAVEKLLAGDDSGAREAALRVMEAEAAHWARRYAEVWPQVPAILHEINRITEETLQLREAAFTLELSERERQEQSAPATA